LRPPVATVDELCGIVRKWGAHPNAWAEALIGQRVQGDLKRNLAEILASPSSAAQVIDSLSPQATVALALFAENDDPWVEPIFFLPLGRTIGPRCVPAAAQELGSRGLWFTSRAPDPWRKDTFLTLPEVLKIWLRPELEGLLRATDKVVEISEAEPTSDQSPFDPSLDLMFLLAGVATYRPRITVGERRLFARERTRLAGLLKQPDSGELDGLVGDRAHLLADDARRVLRPRQAAIAVDDGHSQDLLALGGQVELGDGARRAGRAAGAAVVEAVPEPGRKDRRPQSREAGLAQARLQSRGGADLEALATAQTARQKVALVGHPGRSDEARVAAQVPHAGAQQRHPAEPGRRGHEKVAPAGVVGLPRSGPQAQREAHARLSRAGDQTVQADRALRRDDLR